VHDFVRLCHSRARLFHLRCWCMLPHVTVASLSCHWGGTIPDRSKPEEEGCPWNFYRSSGDVRASYASIRGNLATTIPLAAKNLSYPGCWAYP
jgi:hypothetical protein